ncbi:MAG: VWA domain-containing protein [Acidobacteriota bacterium]|nr:VWA domain-containing protein [Acidobacteriota bacterium]
MFYRRSSFIFVSAVLICLAAVGSRAQSGRVLPIPTPAEREGPDQVTVFTEEVRVPVFARDQYDRSDPTLEPLDVLVLEDNVPQQVRSVRRTPASVLLLVSVGGELNPALSLKVSRAAALGVVAALREGDSLAVMQFDNRVELLQGWTTDKGEAQRAVRNKLHAGSGARTAEALQKAAALFTEQSPGNRHIVLITDGVDTPGGQQSKPAELTRILSSDAMILGGRNGLAEAMRQLQAAQATVHVVSYTAFGRREIKEREKRALLGTSAPPGSVRASGIATAGIDPTVPPTVNRGGAGGPSRGDGITFDSGVKKMRKAYGKAMERSEQQLKTLAAETGGRLFLPASAAELVEQGVEVAREIATQYVVTYTPKRPLADGPATEYRRLTVLPRRSGLTLRARRGYVTAAMR